MGSPPCAERASQEEFPQPREPTTHNAIGAVGDNTVDVAVERTSEFVERRLSPSSGVEAPCSTRQGGQSRALELNARRRNETHPSGIGALRPGMRRFG